MATADASIKLEAQKILAPYPAERSELIPVLQQFMARWGYLPQDAMREAARHLRVPESTIFSTATFYALFSLKPRGKHVISVCQGTSCFVRGSDRLLDRLKEELGIGLGETTPDLKFSLEEVRCVGCCALAPVLTSGEHVHGRVRVNDLPELVKRYRNDE